jgi:PAS domain S-box-containing protein
MTKKKIKKTVRETNGGKTSSNSTSQLLSSAGGNSASRAALRRKAEEQLIQRLDGLDALWKQDPRNLIQELVIHQIELELQNEELRRAEEALARERVLLDAVMNATDVMLVYLDAEFNFVWVNAAYAETCKMRPEEMIGKNHFALYPHEENETIFRRVRDTGGPVFYKDKPFEFPDQPERGITYWDWSLVPVKDDSGRVTGLVFSLRETTKYKEAEMALAASEARFRRMAEISADIIFQIDPVGEILYISPVIRSFGYTADQVVGRPFAKFIPPDELPKAMAALMRMKNGESISLFLLKVVKADGTIADCEINATPIVRDGIVIGMQGITRDITERLQIEAALKTSLARFELLAATASELLRATEPHKVLESVCYQTMEHLGCDVCYNLLAFEADGKFRLNACAGISEEDVSKIETEINITAGSDSSTRACRPIVAVSTGGAGPLLASGIRTFASYPLAYPDGTIVGTLFFGARKRATFSRDDLAFMQAVADQVAVAITRLHHELRLKKQSIELAYANRELEAFSYAVSHDLRTPLRSIEGFTAAIIEDYGAGLEKGAREYFDKAITASQRMGQLIDAMLDMARLTGTELKESNVNLSNMAEVVAYELGKTSPEREMEWAITRDMKVQADFNLLRIVVENLLNNAWKFTAGTDKARIEFNTMQMADGEPHRQTVYFVRDNGAGFDPDYAGKLFDPFARLHSEAEFPGLGIGLATVKKIIVRHGGKIWAQGEPGKGATFYFTLE